MGPLDCFDGALDDLAEHALKTAQHKHPRFDPGTAKTFGELVLGICGANGSRSGS